MTIDSNTANVTGNFNLVDGAWIPVLWRNGHVERVGIRKALAEAASIRQIAASNPMDNISILRFLSAVLLWCNPNAKAQLQQLADEQTVGIRQDWLSNLDQFRDAFNLLGEGKRFYQDSSLRDKPPRPIADLLVEFPGADSVNHLRHVVHDGSYGFCPACCALGILRLSVWASANSFYPASVNPASAAYAIVEERNLLETLRANLPTMAADPSQAPWIISQTPVSPDAIANLAWRPRKLWLNVAQNVGPCANCENNGPIVGSLCTERGWPTPMTGGQQFGKAVEAEFKKLNYAAKDKNVQRAVQAAQLIRQSRMSELQEVDNNADTAPQQESTEQTIARVFDQLFTGNNAKAVKSLTKKATPEEQQLLGTDAIQTKKFWPADPHLLKETEPIGLPDLNANVAIHSSRFWRDAVRLHNQGHRKTFAIGPVVNKFMFQDATCVSVPPASAKQRIERSSILRDCIHGLIKATTPNPKRLHPEVEAAVVLLTPDAEAQVRASLRAIADERVVLNEVYAPVVERTVASTACGSPLRRRAAKGHAKALLNKSIERTVNPQLEATKAGDESRTDKRKKRGKA